MRRVEEISRRLSYAGLVVENVEKLTPGFTGVFAARVLHVEKHPNADRLNLCDVDAGEKGQFKVVCGAPNVKAGMVAPLALVGAQLWQAAAAGGSRHSRRAFRGHALLGARARPVAGSGWNPCARRGCAAGWRRGRVFAPRRYRARCRNHPESRRLPVSSRPGARGRSIVRRQTARAQAPRGAFGGSPDASRLFGFGFHRCARSVPSLRRARDDRNQGRSFAGVAQAPAGTMRDARAEQRGRCDQLRDARTRPALARVRLRQNRRRPDYRPPRRRYARVRHPRQRRAHARVKRSADRRQRQAARDRRRDGRPQLRGRRFDAGLSCSRARTSSR